MKKILFLSLSLIIQTTYLMNHANIEEIDAQTNAQIDKTVRAFIKEMNTGLNRNTMVDRVILVRVNRALYRVRIAFAPLEGWGGIPERLTPEEFKNLRLGNKIISVYSVNNKGELKSELNTDLFNT